jgi:hypothetical protein
MSASLQHTTALMAKRLVALLDVVGLEVVRDHRVKLDAIRNSRRHVPTLKYRA